jgi:hypothetical protein
VEADRSSTSVVGRINEPTQCPVSFFGSSKCCSPVEDLTLNITSRSPPAQIKLCTLNPLLSASVNQASKAGVPVEQLRAALDGKPDDLPEELRDAYHFAMTVVTRNGDEDALRERIRLRYGDEGLIEMALAIASCRVFPITKRALGYAVSCTAMPVRV